jgi:hypothetical protein
MNINPIMTLAAVLVAVLLCGCSDGGEGYPSSEGMPYPYILKTGCDFAIVEELSRSTISSPVATGMPDTWVTASISLGDHSISVSNCEVVENPASLPIYED